MCSRLGVSASGSVSLAMIKRAAFNRGQRFSAHFPRYFGNVARFSKYRTTREIRSWDGTWDFARLDARTYLAGLRSIWTSCRYFVFSKRQACWPWVRDAERRLFRRGFPLANARIATKNFWSPVPIVAKMRRLINYPREINARSVKRCGARYKLRCRAPRWRCTMVSSLQCAIRSTLEYNANDNWRNGRIIYDGCLSQQCHDESDWKSAWERAGKVGSGLGEMECACTYALVNAMALAAFHALRTP